MKKRIFALLMAMILVLGMSTTVFADTDSPTTNNTQTNSPVIDNTPTVPPVEEDTTVEVQDLDVAWSTTDAWTLEVENVATGDEYLEAYAIIYKDGEWIDRLYCPVTVNNAVTFDLSRIVSQNGNGKYSVEVEVLKSMWVEEEDRNTWVLVYEGKAEDRTYTKPSTQLATPANLSVDVTTGKITFDAVKDAVAYDIWFVTKYASNDEYAYSFVRVEKPEYIYEDMAEMIEYYKENYSNADIYIKIGVSAVSENIDKVAYSDRVEYTLFENKVSKEQLVENFDKALENVEEEPDVAVNVLAQVSNDTIIELMETDAAFVEKVAKLDDVIVEKIGEAYKGSTSETKLVDASKVSVMGIAINALDWVYDIEDLESVELSFAEPKEAATVPEGYKKGVQLDINLLINGDARENLAVPVTITMPIPEGVATKDLVILHYHGDATEPVVIVPTVNADGTMTFIVDGFSTFVVTNQVVEAGVPATGDNSGVTVVCSILLLAAGVVLVSRRNAFAK